MKNQITYTEHNGLYYPDLALPEQTDYPFGKYGNLRLDFMKKHRRGTYTTLLTEGRLNEYLHAIDIQARKLLDDIIPRLAQERGIDEVLKAHKPLQWVAEMNNITWPSSPGFSPVMPGRNLAFMQVVHFVVSGHPVLPNADYIIFKDQRKSN